MCVSWAEKQNTGEISFYKCTYCRYFSSPFNLLNGSLKHCYDVIPHACCQHSLSEVQVRKPFHCFRVKESKSLDWWDNSVWEAGFKSNMLSLKASRALFPVCQLPMELLSKSAVICNSFNSSAFYLLLLPEVWIPLILEFFRQSCFFILIKF